MLDALKEEFVPQPLRAVIEGEQWRDRLAKADPGLRVALRSVKPYLDFVKVRHDVSAELLPPNAIPGCWHVRDKSAKPLPVFMPITDAAGYYREPDSGVLRELSRTDMRKRDVAREVFDRPETERKRKEHELALKAEQRKDEMVSDLRAGWRVSGTGGLNRRWWGKK